MKFIFSILLLCCATTAVAMNNKVKMRIHDNLINRASDNAYCKFGEWGSEDGEPVDAMFPKEWHRSLPYEEDEQEKLQEAIQKMQEKRNTYLRQTTRDGSCPCLVAIALTCCLAPFVHEYLK